jgi:hypothetical protein
MRGIYSLQEMITCLTFLMAKTNHQIAIQLFFVSLQKKIDLFKKKRLNSDKSSNSKVNFFEVYISISTSY